MLRGTVIVGLAGLALLSGASGTAGAAAAAGTADAAAPAPAGAAATDGAPRPLTYAALGAELRSITSDPEGPPGIGLWIHRNGRDEHSRSGFAMIMDRERPGLGARGIWPGIHARIASVSKAYNGAVLLALASRGRIRLGDRVADLLPGRLPRAGGVTLRQTLQHTGGLPDYIREPRFLERLIEAPTRPIAPPRILNYVRGSTLTHRPGTAFEYSDTDNVVAALAAQRVTGRSYERLMRDLILRPLWLPKTSLPRTLGLPGPAMHGYEVGPGMALEDVTRAINPSLAWASGGMVSTMPEVGRFMRAYVSGRLFAPRRRAAVRRAQMRFVPGASSPPGPGRNSAGLGIFRYRTACGPVFGHTGSFPGYRLFAASTLDGRRSVVMFVNAQIVPGMGSPAISDAIRRVQHQAVCRALSPAGSGTMEVDDRPQRAFAGS